MWGGPLFSFAGVVALVFADRLPATVRAWAERRLVWWPAPHRMAVAAGWAGVVVCAGLAAARNVGGPHVRGKVGRVHCPGPAIAAAAEAAWATVGEGAPPVVGGPYFHAALVNAYAADPARRPRLLYDFDSRVSPWTSDAEINARGAVFVWDVRPDIAEPPADLLDRFPRLRFVHVRSLPYRTAADVPPLPLAVAVVPPAGADGLGAATRTAAAAGGRAARR